MSPAASTPAPSALRGAIVVHLRQAGPASPDAIAAAVGASRSGVVQQLRALEVAGLVSHCTVRHGVGRPRHLYDVTPDAQSQLPSNYDGLVTGLVDAIVDVGGEALLDEVFAARRRRLATRTQEKLAARTDGTPDLAARFAALAEVQDEQGYLAEARIGADGVLRLVEHNCAIWNIASRVPAACESELALFCEVLGTDLERESYLPAGDRCCSYRVAGTAAGTA